MNGSGLYNTIGTEAWEQVFAFDDPLLGLPHGATVSVLAGSHASTELYLQHSGKPAPNVEDDGLVVGDLGGGGAIELFAPHPGGLGQALALWVRVQAGAAEVSCIGAWAGGGN